MLTYNAAGQVVIPVLPVSCFGIAISTREDEFEGRIEKFDNDVYWVKQPRKEKAKAESVNKRRSNRTDTLKPEISTAAPGSTERIEALAAFYEKNAPTYDSHERAKLNGEFVNEDDCISPYNQTLEEMADALIEKADAISRKMEGERTYSKSRRPMNTSNMD